MNYIDGDEIPASDVAVFREYMSRMQALPADEDPDSEIIMISTGYAEIWPDGDVVQHGAMVVVVDEDGDPDEDETERRLRERAR